MKLASFVMVNPRLQMTDLVTQAFSAAHQIPISSSSRQHVEIVKAAKTRRFLADRAPISRALADSSEAMKQLLSYLEAGKEESHQQTV